MTMRRKLPPGPWNFLGWLTYRHAVMLCWDPIRYARRLTRKYGDILTLRLFSRRAFIVNSPAGVLEVLVEQDSAFRKQRRQMRILERVFRQGLLVSEGQLWKQQRQSLQIAFSRSNFARYVDICADETLRRTQNWETDSPIDLADELTSILVATMGRIFFGTTFTGRQEELIRIVREVSLSLIHEIEVMIPFSSLLPSQANRRHKQARRRLAELVDELVQARISRSHEPHDDFISLLLQETAAVVDNPKQVASLVRDEVTTLVVAANHTITAAAAWMFKAVVENETVCRTTQREIVENLGDGPFTWDACDQLPYTQAVVREALRMYPPAWSLFVREAVRDVNIQGYRIRSGDWVFIYPILLHHDERWFAEPSKFEPQRFLDMSINRQSKGAYIPFGLGQHTCIGAQLSHAVLMTMLVTIVRQYTPTDAADSRFRDVVHRDVAMRPAFGVPVRLRWNNASPAQRPRSSALA